MSTYDDEEMAREAIDHRPVDIPEGCPCGHAANLHTADHGCWEDGCMCENRMAAGGPPEAVCYCGSGLEGHDPRHAKRPREGYQFRHYRPCRGCHARIAWWETPAGKWSPHDLDGVSHFATCPLQEQFRKANPA